MTMNKFVKCLNLLGRACIYLPLGILFLAGAVIFAIPVFFMMTILGESWGGIKYSFRTGFVDLPRDYFKAIFED